MRKLLNQNLRALMAIVFFGSGLSFPDAFAKVPGSEVRTGGSVVRTPSGRVRLADFYFQREGQQTLRIGKELVDTIRRGIDWIDYELRLDTLDDLKLAIFGQRSEYLFVDNLPSDCGFLDHTEISRRHGELKNIGCTLGYLTYIDPDLFVELTLEDQALFIIHERLHNVAPSTSYDVKVDVVKAMGIYFEKIIPAKVKYLLDSSLNRKAESLEILTDKDIEILNKLPLRISQLNFVGTSQRSQGRTLNFTKSGSVMSFSPIKPQGAKHWVMPSVELECLHCQLSPTQQLRLALPQFGGDIRVSIQEGRLNLETNMNRVDEEGAYYSLLAEPIRIQDPVALKNLWKGFCIGIELLDFQMAEPIAALGSRSTQWSAHPGCFE